MTVGSQLASIGVMDAIQQGRRPVANGCRRTNGCPPSIERVLETIRRHRRAMLENPAVDEVNYELEGFNKGGVGKFRVEVLYHYSFAENAGEAAVLEIMREHLEEAGRDLGVSSLHFRETKKGGLTARYRFCENTGAV